jgi:hypothetical protein
LTLRSRESELIFNDAIPVDVRKDIFELINKLKEKEVEIKEREVEIARKDTNIAVLRADLAEVENCYDNAMEKLGNLNPRGIIDELNSFAIF